MVKITHKEFAELLGVSVGYSRQLLHREGLRMESRYLREIVGLLCKRMVKGGKDKSS